MLLRIIVAIVGLVLFYGIFDPLVRFLDLPLSGDASTVIKYCAIGIAAFYVLKGYKGSAG